MDFEFFTEDGRSFAPRASIRSNGQIGFNQGAVKRFNIKDGQFAILGFDKQEKAIAIKRVTEAEKGSKRISVRENNAWVAAKGFLDFFAIGYKDGKSYDICEKEGLLVFELDK